MVMPLPSALADELPARRISLIAQPPVLFVIAAFAYLGAYVLLYPFAGPAVGGLAAVPVMAAGWRFGRRAGLLTAVAFLGLNVVLHALFDPADNVSLMRSLPGYLSLGLVGLMSGWRHDLTAALHLELSQRQRAEAALLTGERRFRALIEYSAEAITLLSADGTVLYDSPAAQRILGVPADARIGRNTFAHIHPDDLPHVQQSLRRVLEGPPEAVHSTFRFQHPTGSWRWLEAVANNLLAEPSVHAVVVNYRDVTERKLAEARLHLQGSALQAAANAIIITDTAGQIVWVNPAFTDLTGYAAEDAIGQTPRLLKSGEQSREYYQSLWETIAAGQTWHGEIVNRKKDGRLYTEEMTVTPVQGEDGQISHFIAIKQDVSARKQAEAQIRRQLDRLAALRSIDQAITGSLDLRLTLGVFLEHVLTQLGVHAADVLLLEPQDQTLAYATGRGFQTSSFQHLRVRLGEGRAGRAALARRIVAEVEPVPARPPSARTGLLGGEHFASYYGVPLIAKGQLLGVLEIFHRAPLQPGQEWLDFLEALAGQAAIAIENATLFGGLQRLNQELTQAYDATIEGWSRALDLRDKETEGHSQRVTEYTLRLAQAMNVSETALVHVRRGALLHDIGKMGVPDHILFKTGPLSDAEWVLMRQHPTHAYALLSPIAYLQPALDIPYCHHEKWDGTGYPRGLRGEQIPLAARLFAVVDVWDALSSDRPYRPAWPAGQVLAHLRSLAGSHFDPRAVEAFLQLLG
jgi:PAS domain S-box-containing protein